MSAGEEAVVVCARMHSDFLFDPSHYTHIARCKIVSDLGWNMNVVHV